ncbi:MAG: MotA/TolQ/ExbB proton channel family protein [Bacteroidota bacterium]
MEKKTDLSSIFAAIVIPLCLVVAILIFMFILGNPANFIDNNPANHPKQGNYLGVVYKGGYIVPLLMSMAIMVIVFSIERFITIRKAHGKGNIASFVNRVQSHLTNNALNAAISECNKQKGSVANVILAGLEKYQAMGVDKQMSKDQKLLAIQQEVEETTALELPMLQKNLSVIATLAPIGTLVGLFGTVLGMIKAFAALATAGAPDAVALSTGISEALINTALGIGTSAVAIIVYNYFTGSIDEMTYAIDEAGYSISQNFASKH